MPCRRAHASIAAGLALMFAAAVVPAEAQTVPACLPTPDLACVTPLAVAAIDRIAAGTDRTFIYLEDLAGAVAAQRKLGDVAGAARLVALARAVEGRSGGTIRLARFLARVDPEAGRVMARRMAEDIERQLAAGSATPPSSIYAGGGDAGALASVLGLAAGRDEGLAFLRRVRALADPIVAARGTDAAEYSIAMAEGYGALADPAGAEAMLAQAWAAIHGGRTAAANAGQLLPRFAAAAIAAGAHDRARAAAAALEPADPVRAAMLAYTVARAAADATALRAAMDRMQAQRAAAMAASLGEFVTGTAQWHFWLLLGQGDTGAARAVADEAWFALRAIDMASHGRAAHAAMGAMAAALGDTARVDAILMAFRRHYAHLSTPLSLRADLRGEMGELCPVFAQHGHAEAALRCAGALAELSDGPVTIPLMRTYAALAGALARR